MRNNNRVLYNLIWIIGAFLLVYSSSYILDDLKRQVGVLYITKYYLWGTVIVAFVFGM